MLRLLSGAIRPAIAALAVASVSSVSTAQAESHLFSGVSLGVGAFVSVAPAYEGSDEYKVRGLPIAFPVFNGRDEGQRSRLTFRGVDDVRISVFRRGGFDIGPIVGYSFGREEDLSTKLTGLGNVDGGVVLGGFGSYTAGGAFVEAGISTQVTGDEDTGYVAALGAGYTVDLSDRVSVTGRVSTDYISADYADRYFSVTAAQAAASAYNQFDADAGFKDATVGLSATFAATDRLSLRAGVSYSRLIGDVADSPISESDNQFSGNFGMQFRF